MNVYVDQNKCQTAAVCVKVCPEVFTFTMGSKKAVVRGNPVSSRWEALVREAALKCPSRAITVTE
ncbi:MAG: ferredoxin [Spirochaetia bacterium]